ncbi:hypothetical protein HCH52_04890 [Oscillospiraceae bacterium HV4-5-C5C]|nr:hypothetical protein [Oscillospiraceae bacterium HV4-5-C5C]
MKQTLRRLIQVSLAGSMVFGALAGCSSGTGSASTTKAETTVEASNQDSSGSSQAAGESSSAAAGEGGLDEGGVTNATGFPITNEPITLTAAVQANSLLPDMADSNVWQAVADKTGITLDIEVLSDRDKIDLMYASGDFPDIMMRTDPSANQLTTAVDSGYFVELEPLLEQYAPTWYTYLQNNPMMYNSSLATDGKLYGLPYVEEDPTSRNLRDQWVIMQSWLDELNLAVPTTTEEFKDALVAIKENAGKGSIPEDVIPFYFFFDNYIGGQFDIYGSFGVYITSGDYLVVDNGVVKDQSTNPDIKEPLKYLRDLYALGVIPPEVFTDDWNTYASKISSDPAVVGSYFSYAIRQLDTATAMKPLDSGNGSTPLMRSQAYTPAPSNTAIITTENKYPIATTRLFEAIASDNDLRMEVGRGTKGIVWDYDDSGKAYLKFWEENTEKWTENSKELGTQNSFVGLFDKSFYANNYTDVYKDQVNSRSWSYYNVYEDSVMPNDMVYVGGSLDQDDTNMASQYATDLSTYRKATFADFITGKQDIDANWDSYVAQMKSIGLDDFVALRQKAYDIMVK